MKNTANAVRRSEQGEDLAAVFEELDAGERLDALLRCYINNEDMWFTLTPLMAEIVKTGGRYFQDHVYGTYVDKGQDIMVSHRAEMVLLLCEFRSMYENPYIQSMLEVYETRRPFNVAFTVNENALP